MSQEMTKEMTLTLNQEEAEAFLLFRKHQDFIMSLISAQIQDIKNGSATLNFNPQGSLMNVQITYLSFQRKNLTKNKT